MAPKNRAEYRETVAKAFTEALSEKGLKWKAGWDRVNMSPVNAVTGFKYHGINRFHLGLTALMQGYDDPRWATMTQIMDRKGLYHPKEKWHLQAGSKAVFVEYWYPFDNQEKRQMSWQDYRALPKEEQDDPRYQLHVRYTPVFHASMIDGLAPLETPQREPQKLSDVVSTLSHSMDVPLLYDGGNQAFYDHRADRIHLPKPTAFRDEYEFNATALHELAHSTGHPRRLNRDLSGSSGSKEYAFEELVAEISSCFMSVDLDVEQMPEHLANHKAYVQGWIRLLSEQPEALAQAIALAQQAAEYMDYHAGLISEQEYRAGQNRSLPVAEPRTEDPPMPNLAPAPSAPGPTYSLYRLRDDLDPALLQDLYFTRYDNLALYHRSVEAANYRQIYTGSMGQSTTPTEILAHLEEHRPQDFTGRAPHVSDVIVIEQAGHRTAHYIDSRGLRQLYQFTDQLDQGHDTVSQAAQEMCAQAAAAQELEGELGL